MWWTWSTFLFFKVGISSFVSAQQIGSVPKSNADLALNVLQGLQNDPISAKTNPVFSPTSVFYGLSMLYYGMGDSSRQSIYWDSKALSLGRLIPWSEQSYDCTTTFEMPSRFIYFLQKGFGRFYKTIDNCIICTYHSII